jgi:hypothetical protein
MQYSTRLGEGTLQLTPISGCDLLDKSAFATDQGCSRPKYLIWPLFGSEEEGAGASLPTFVTYFEF